MSNLPPDVQAIFDQFSADPALSDLFVECVIFVDLLQAGKMLEARECTGKWTSEQHEGAVVLLGSLAAGYKIQAESLTAK